MDNTVILTGNVPQPDATWPDDWSICISCSCVWSHRVPVWTLVGVLGVVEVEEGVVEVEVEVEVVGEVPGKGAHYIFVVVRHNHGYIQALDNP